MSGHILKIKPVGIFLGIIIFPAADLGLVAHPLHKEYAGTDHTYFDSNNQIKCNSKYKGDHKYQNISLGSGLAKMNEGSPLAHIICNHKQDSCDGRHRYHSRIRH